MDDPEGGGGALGADAQRQMVQEDYGKTVTGDAGCCVSVDATLMGYSMEELKVAAGANFGLGCGNPLSFADLKEGETVVDLGSGAGIDCFLASAKVGPTGSVIGVDMTPEMLHKARANATEKGSTNVEFRLGEIEHLPVADGTVDCVISNCVINLSPDKSQVIKEIYRILKPCGRVAISDVVAKGELPEHLKTAEALSC
jgi:SAM-dependent methyltransferase